MACVHAQPAEATSGAGERILVAEDHPVNQFLVRRILEKNGFEVVLAPDGEAAVALWREDPGQYNLILMDIQMPKMDGLEATRRIRRDERLSGRGIPIVALTAHAMVGDVERCLAAGMDAYLSKPIETERLVSTLRHVLDRRAVV
jgi:CheY-like chemotaxis protein